MKEEGSICTYNVQGAMVVCEKMKHVDFVVYFNSTEHEVLCMCRLFEFGGIMSFLFYAMPLLSSHLMGKPVS